MELTLYILIEHFVFFGGEARVSEKNEAVSTGSYRKFLSPAGRNKEKRKKWRITMIYKKFFGKMIATKAPP